MRVFTGGQGTSAARGTLNGAASGASIYAATITTRKQDRRGAADDQPRQRQGRRLDPPLDNDPRARAGHRAHRARHHRSDDGEPAARAAGHGDLLVPETCQRTLAIFDGRLRYDLKLAYKRMEQVKAEKGYAGPAWSARSISRRSPATSRRAPRSNTSPSCSDIEVWLAPIAGTRVLVPFRAEGPTPIGPGVLKATQFVSTEVPTPRVGRE